MSDPKVVTLATKPKPEAETPAKPAKFSVGDAVILNAGQTPMTVEEVKSGRITAVWHNQGDELCTGFFKAAMLSHLEFEETEGTIDFEPEEGTAH